MPDYVRVAMEGPTIDGREISAAHIAEMAESYNPDIYGARIWVEHLRTFLPEGTFQAYGDVRALKADTIDGKAVLLAEIEPTDALRALNRARQKIFTSVEITDNFADSGKAYLTGLAVTDSPASLGTQALKFSLAHGARQEDGKAGTPATDKRFSAYLEGDFSAVLAANSASNDDTPAAKPVDTRTLADVKALFASLFGTRPNTQPDTHPGTRPIAGAENDNPESADAVSSNVVSSGVVSPDRRMAEMLAEHHVGLANAESRMDGLRSLVADVNRRLSGLEDTLGSTPAAPPRPEATGGAGHLTDC